MPFLRSLVIGMFAQVCINTLSAEEPELFSLKTSSPTAVFLEVDAYTFEKDDNLSDREILMIQHVKKSMEHAWLGFSHILESIQRQIEGRSNTRIRHLLSNLCSIPNTRYLEIGTWKGGTFIAALCNNQETIDYAVGIDNWSDGGREDFERNCTTFLPRTRYNYEFYSEDCFAIDPNRIIKMPINVFFYSGDRSIGAQEKAFTYYNDVLDDVFIAVIDGWNFESVRSGTINAMNKLDYEVLFEVALPGHKVLWWEGLYVAVIRKPTGLR